MSGKARMSIVNLPEFKRAMTKAADRVIEGATWAVREEVDAIRDDAVKFAPRDKGDLERGIRSQALSLKGEVRATARHSVFVEHGTYKDAAQPFMAPAALRSQRRLPARAAAIIKRALEGVR